MSELLTTLAVAIGAPGLLAFLWFGMPWLLDRVG